MTTHNVVVNVTIPKAIGHSESFSLERNSTNLGRDADLLIMVNSQIPTDNLIVHFL
nr:hypothetical protein 49p1_00199 [Yersinia frederiksenii]